MDTRFWGPSGWKLLHLITFNYKQTAQNEINYANFFETLPFILPCKYCRASLTDYYRELPFRVGDRLIDGIDLRKWMYDIHNCVNGKLQKQGLNPSPNPKYSVVKQFYEDWLKCDWHAHLTIFWDFLFAVAYNHPKETTPHSKPMPDCPVDAYKCKDKCEKNKWNLLSFTDRLYWFKRFWFYLPVVLPIEIKKQWEEIEKVNPPTLDCRRATLAWLWRMRCALDVDFKDPYTSVCKKIAKFSSDCGKKPKAITCRKQRSFRRKRIKKTVKNKK